MKKLVWFFIFLLTTYSGISQILQPAKIDVSVSSTNVKAGDEIILTFKATIDENWYLYSNGFDEDCGPIPFSINLTKNNNFVLAGNLTAEKDKGKHDDIFDCDVRYMTSTGTFKQKIKVLSGPLQLSGTFEGQVCSEKDGKCIPVDGDIELPVIQVSGKASSEKPNQDNLPKAEENKNEVKENPFASKENILPAGDTSSQTQENIIKNNGAAIQGPILDANLSAQANPETSFVWFFLLAFVAGLAALLTPCVFPMRPMTVSFCTGQQNSKSKDLLYGAFIVGIYTIIGALLAPLMGPETANHLSTEWLPNLIFFAVFIVFGLSFLGLFEITLPSGLVNK
ncbi:MAG: protein-disulfide reductase DsbD domain-containing protein, partial [Chryseotalea sp.]